MMILELVYSIKSYYAISKYREDNTSAMSSTLLVCKLDGTSRHYSNTSAAISHREAWMLDILRDTHGRNYEVYSWL